MPNIAHISDIHIRLYQRYDEYKGVFNNLFDSLKENDIDHIVLTGDVFHSRINLSPEAIELFDYLMDGLTDVAPTILIAGNHDAVLTAKNARLDALTPLVDRYNKNRGKKISYFKDTGVFNWSEDLDYVVYSVLDDQEPNLKDRKAKRSIALYHGIISGSVLPNGRTIETVERVFDFKDFDAVMLGDIHKVQQVNKNGYYAGSLIQQNFGEDVENHGYVLWDLDSLKPKFVRIENPYGYYNITFKNGKFDAPPYVSEKARIRLYYPSAIEYTKIRKLAEEEYPTQTIDYNKLTEDEINNDVNIGEDIVNLFDINTIEGLIRQYYDGDEVLEDVLKLNKQVFEENQQSINDNFIGGNFEIKRFEFNNLFLYGEGNVFDFTNKEGTLGLFSANRSGKSSFLNALMFGLYGNVANINRQDEIINNKSDNYSSAMTLLKDGDSYEIKRTGKLNNSGLVNKLHLYKNGESIGGTINETNKMIRELFGDYDTFYKLFYIRQTNPEMFLDLSPMERKQWLYDNLGVDIFDILHRSAKDKYNALSYKMKELLKIDFEGEIEHYEYRIATKEGFVKRHEKEIKANKKASAELTKKIEGLEIHNDTEYELAEMKSKLSTTEQNLTIATEKVSKLENVKKEDFIDTDQIKKIETTISEREIAISDLKELIASDINDEMTAQYTDRIEEAKKKGAVEWKKQSALKKELDHLERTEVEDLEKELATVIENRVSTQSDITVTTSLIEQYRKSTTILSEDDRFEKEDLCQTCPLLSNAFESKDRMQEKQQELQELREKVEQITKKQTELSEELEHRRTINDKFDQLDEVSSEIKKLLIEIEHSKEALKSYRNNIKEKSENKIESLKNAIESNRLEIKSIRDEANSKIESAKKELEINKERVVELTKVVEDLKSEIKKKERRIEDSRKNKEARNQLKESRDKLNDEVDRLQNNLTEISNELSVLQSNYDDLLEKKKEYDDVQGKLKIYEAYTNATHKDALPLLFVENILGVFQNEINKVINQITPLFKIEIEIEGNNVNAYMSDGKDKWSTSLASGMERFVINMAFRTAIAKVGNVVKPNFMIVDEGFNALDSDNQQSIPDVFEYLKQDFDYIFVVSHSDIMRDFVDMNVEITHDDSFAYIQY